MSFLGFLRQSTAVDVRIGPFVDSTDGDTEETALTIANTDTRLSKNGQTAVARNDATSCAHDADGNYNCEFDATDTNTVGGLELFVHVAGALAVKHTWMVLEEAVYDRDFASGATGVDADWTNTGRLDTLLDAIPTTAMRGTDSAATAANLATAQLDLDTITDADGVVLGAAGVDLIWDEVLTGGTHNVVNSAGRRLRQIQEAGGYSGGAIYIDTVNGSAGTTNFENGVDSNPVNSIADANTLAASLGISTFSIAAGSSITLAATQANQTFRGDNWTLALGGQSIDGSVFIGATISGIGTNTAGVQHLVNCILNACTLPGDTHCEICAIAGTQTMGEAGDYFFDRCHSAVAGSGSPTIDFGAALNASNLNIREYSGGWTVENMGAGTGTYEATFEGQGQITWAASCSATSNAEVRGNWKITDSASGAVTVTLDDNQSSIDALEVTVGTAGDGLTAVTLGTDGLDANALATDAITEIVAGVWNAARATYLAAGSMGETHNPVINGQAATGTLSATQATTNLTAYADDELIGRTIYAITGARTGEATDITDYENTNGRITFTAMTGAMADGDRFLIY